MNNSKAKTKLTLTLDAKLKKSFMQLCEDIGLPASSVVTAMIGQAVRKQEVKISSLDINGLTPKKAAELKRRWEEVKAMRNKQYDEELN